MGPDVITMKLIVLAAIASATGAQTIAGVDPAVIAAQVPGMAVLAGVVWFFLRSMDKRGEATDKRFEEMRRLHEQTLRAAHEQCETQLTTIATQNADLTKMAIGAITNSMQMAGRIEEAHRHAFDRMISVEAGRQVAAALDKDPRPS
jgi:hypothetical protein